MRSVLIYDTQELTSFAIESLLTNNIKQELRILRIQNKSELIDTIAVNSDALVILDYNLSDIESAHQLLNISTKYPLLRWILFPENLTTDFIKHILVQSESFSVVLKSSELIEISYALKVGLENKRFICREVTEMLISAPKAVAEDKSIRLTQTEKEILRELSLGQTTKDIACNRHLSIHTVTTHRKNIFRKLEVNNIQEAIKYAMRAGIIDICDYYI